MFYNDYPTNNYSDQNIDYLYPDIISKIQPYIDDVTSRFQSGEIDESTLESLVQDILIRSGLSEYIDEDDEAIPTQGPIVFGGPMGGFRRPMGGQRGPWYPYPQPRRPRTPYYPTYPRPYNYGYRRLRPEDIIRILLMRQLWGY